MSILRKVKPSPILVILIIIGGLISLMGVDYAFSMIHVGNSVVSIALEADGKIGQYISGDIDVSGKFLSVETPFSGTSGGERCTGSAKALVLTPELYVVGGGSTVIQRVTLKNLFQYTYSGCKPELKELNLRVKLDAERIKGTPVYATVGGAKDPSEAAEFLRKAEQLESRCSSLPIGPPPGGCDAEWRQAADMARSRAQVNRVPVVCRNETRTIIECKVGLPVPLVWGNSLTSMWSNYEIHVDIYALPPEGSIFTITYQDRVELEVWGDCPEGTTKLGVARAVSYGGRMEYQYRCGTRVPALVLIKVNTDITTRPLVTTITTSTLTTLVGTRETTMTAIYQTTVPNLIIQTINNPTTITLQAFQKTHTLTIANPAEQAQQLAKEYSPQPRKPLLWIINEWFKNIFNTLMKFITGA